MLGRASRKSLGAQALFEMVRKSLTVAAGLDGEQAGVGRGSRRDARQSGDEAVAQRRVEDGDGAGAPEPRR